MKTRIAVFLSIPLLASGACLAGPLEEAMARITELNQTVQSQNERLNKLEAQLQNQGLLGLLNKVEALKTDVAHLRGAQEEQVYRLEAADKRAKDLFADLDERLKEVASRPISVAADSIRLQSSQTLVAAPPAIPVMKADAETEARAYEIAHTLIKAGKYIEAISAFDNFINQYPSGALAANALYWKGISQVTGRSDFKGAADSYQRLLKDFPASPKVADALLSLARAQIQLEQKEQAKATLGQLLEKHPISKAAENGKKLLATLN